MDRRTENHRRADSTKEFLKLISEFKSGYFTVETLYSRAVVCYDLLLEILEGKDMADHNTQEIRHVVEEIVDLLLYNSSNDPFIALGLPYNADKETIRSRWKRLLCLYHPDRYSNKLLFEERAKRINEAFKETAHFKRPQTTNRAARERSHGRSENRKRTFHSSRTNTSLRSSSFLRHLPLFVIGLAILLVSLSVFLFVHRINNVNKVSNKQSKKIEKEELTSSRSHLSDTSLTIKNSNKVIEKASLKITELETFSIPKFDESISKDTTVRTNDAMKKQNHLFQEKKVKNNHQGEKFAFYYKKGEQIPESIITAPVLKKESSDTKTVTSSHTSENLPGGPEIPERPAESGDSQLSSPPTTTTYYTFYSRSGIPPDALIVEETNRLIEDFVVYYETSNLEGYLSLFTEDAKENGVPIKSLTEKYKKRFFDVKNRLKISNIFIRINSRDNVVVSADFSLDRFYIKEIAFYKSQGRIRWVLEKRNQHLLIKQVWYE